MGETYPVGTLADMARIPREAWPRFIAELPVILEEVARIQAAVDILNDVAAAEALRVSIEEACWIDDDLQMIDTTITMAGETPIELTRHFGAAAQ